MKEAKSITTFLYSASSLKPTEMFKIHAVRPIAVVLLDRKYDF